jgi:hypothetical protein
MRGKWSQPGVPHKGWSCIGIDDLRCTSSLCEMCETQEIRYVHRMKHPEYPEVLDCGCVCAGNMEEDVIAARYRESALRSLADKRDRWALGKWKISRNGNSYVNKDGYSVVLFPVGTQWTFIIRNISTNKVIKYRETFDSEFTAKSRSFDALLWVKKNYPVQLAI